MDEILQVLQYMVLVVDTSHYTPVIIISLFLAQQKKMQERLGDSAVLFTGRKLWLRGRKTMAAPGRGDAGKDEVMEGKGAKSTGANTAHVHGAERTVEVTVVGLGGESTGRGSAGKSKFAGLVPFIADYRTARTHPPRNN